MNAGDWREVRLGDVCTYSTAKVSITEINEDNYISTENMLPNKNGVVKSSGLPTVASVTRYFTDNVLVSNIRPYFKKIWCADREGGCSNDVLVFVVKDKRILDSRFLFYCLSNDEFFNYVMAGAKGTKMPRGDKGAILKYPVHLPTLPEQKAIAATLSALDDMIELNNQINKTLEETAQAIFKSWFVDFEPFKDGEFEESELGLIPKGWRVGTLGECIAFINGYAFKSKELLDKDIGECYHVFKMGNIKKGGGLNTEGTKSYIEKNKCKNMDKYILQSGDLLMCMTDMKGNVALLGHTALMNEDGKYIVNQRVGLIRVNNNFGIGYPHLYILTNTKDFIENLRAHANSGVQVNLSTKEILSSKIIIPEKSVNDKFNDIVKPYFDEIFCMIKENQILKTIRETLLPKLMSGEIRVPVEEIE